MQSFRNADVQRRAFRPSETVLENTLARPADRAALLSGATDVNHMTLGQLAAFLDEAQRLVLTLGTLLQHDDAQVSKHAPAIHQASEMSGDRESELSAEDVRLSQLLGRV